MAPQKKRAATSPGKTRMFKLRLPEDIALRIEQKAKAEGRPLARTVINELARFPALDQVDKYADRLSDMTPDASRSTARVSNGSKLRKIWSPRSTVCSRRKVPRLHRRSTSSVPHAMTCSCASGRQRKGNPQSSNCEA